MNQKLRYLIKKPRLSKYMPKQTSETNNWTKKQVLYVGKFKMSQDL